MTVARNREGDRERAEALFSAGDVQGALALYRRLVRAAPQDAELQNDLGTVCFAAGELEASLRHIRRALSLRPDFPEARSNLAMACRSAGLSPESDGNRPWRITFLDPCVYCLLPLWRAIRERPGVRCQWAVTRERASRDLVLQLGGDRIIYTPDDPRGPALTRFVEVLQSDVIISSTWNRAETIATDALIVQTFHGLCDKVYYLKPRRAQLYDLLLLPSDFHRALYTRYGVLKEGGPRARVVGWSRIDCYAAPCEFNAREVRADYGFEEGRPVVFYAPTWSKFGQRGLFCRWGDRESAVLERLCREIPRLGATFVVKLHPLLQKELANRDGFWDRLRRAVDRHDHVRLLDAEKKEDPQALLFVTDVLITDTSSIFADYLALDRPIVFIDPRDHGWERTEICASSRPGFIVQEPHDLVEAVADSLQFPARYKHDRKRVFRKLVSHFDGQAAERGADAVLRLLREGRQRAA